MAEQRFPLKDAVVQHLRTLHLDVQAAERRFQEAALIARLSLDVPPGNVQLNLDEGMFTLADEPVKEASPTA